MDEPADLRLLRAIALAAGGPPNPKAAARVESLLADGADPDQADAGGWTPLLCAVMGSQPGLIELLVAAGASRDGRLLGQDGGTPLALALFYGKTDFAALLADPPLPDNLRTAAALGRPIERFIGADGALTSQAGTGRAFHRPLLAFPEWAPSDTRQEILDEALSWASRNDAVDSMAALVDEGADVNANPYRGTPLLWATYADRVDAATWLLDHGADPDLRHDFGGSEHGKAAVAMHLAAQYESLGVLRLLLDRGADPTIRDGAFDATPLGWATHEGSPRAAAMLGAD